MNSSFRPKFAVVAKLLLCLLVLAVIAGCSNLDFYEQATDPNTGVTTTTRLNYVSAGNKKAIKELKLGLHGSMKGYSNDQVEGIAAVAEGVATGLAKSVKPIP